ncbi:MAG: phosphate propanoyltransferase [Bacilli bacterium]
MEIKVGISNRHVHLTKETYKQIFGTDEMVELRPLTQPNEFASDKTLTIKTQKGTIEKVRVLGPFRKYNQVEISKTDSFKLGINPPIRTSGELLESETVTLVSNQNEVVLLNSCIIPTRHIHLTEEDMIKYNLTNKKTVKIAIKGEKGGILDNVYLKTVPNCVMELHLDTDDGNAFLLKQGDIVDII